MARRRAQGTEYICPPYIVNCATAPLLACAVLQRYRTQLNGLPFQNPAAHQAPLVYAECKLISLDMERTATESNPPLLHYRPRKGQLASLP